VQWCSKHDIEPTIVAEMDDASQIMQFGSLGGGLFVGPSPLEREICRRYGVEVIGRVPELRSELFAISSDRRVQHPAVRAACDAICRQELL
jgi:LysR family transcriptional activator of nhaA